MNHLTKQEMTPQTEQKKKHWFVFCQDELLLYKHNGALEVPYQEESPVPLSEWTTVHRISEEDYTFSIPSPITEDDNRRMMGLRASYNVLPKDIYLRAGKCREILYWDQNTKYCGVCGSPMKLHTAISKRCTECGKEIWPSLAIATIVLVRRNDEVLLVHAHNFRGTFYGLVAGFVETGETLEQCVQREVMEETGLQIRNIRYFGNQPWPYPSGLMVGFYAEYESGSIHLQRSELGGGGWFNRNNLPEIPQKLSIARMLIDAWLENRLEKGRPE